MVTLMKPLLFFAGLLVLGAPAYAETAYEALRILGEARGEAVLNQVVEVSGTNGVPQPEAWTVVTTDPMARGGVRIFGISNGRIQSERTPTRTGSAEPRPMDFNQLNLDSPSAFKVAEQEAQASGVAFDRADYLLRRGDRSPSPVWVITLADRNRRPTAEVNLAAENGRVLAFRSAGGQAADYPREDQQYLERDTADADGSPYRRYQEQDGNGGGFLGKLERFGRRVGNHFKRDGAALDRFFTGDTSIDTEENSR